MATSKAKITDKVTASLNETPAPNPDAKGPASGYRQKLAAGTTRTLDRWGGEPADDIDTADYQDETYPGEFGGPVLPGDVPEPDPEGDPE